MESDLGGRKNNSSIGLIIPALNEELKLRSCVEEAYHALKRNFNDFELVLIDDGSTDSTQKIMHNLASELDFVKVIVNKKNLGLGGTWKRGVDAISKDYIANISGDGGMLEENWDPFLREVGKYTVVTTYVKNLREIKPFFRYLISKGYVKFLNLISGTHLKYYNGPTIYRKEDIKGINIVSNGMGFQSEVLVQLLSKYGEENFCEVPILCIGEKNSNALRLKNVLSIFTTVKQIIRELVRSGQKKDLKV